MYVFIVRCEKNIFVRVKIVDVTFFNEFCVHVYVDARRI